MDPLSMAATVAGLVNLTLKLSQTVSSYCKSVKNAQRDVQQIAQELASMHDGLRHLDDLLRSQQFETKVFESNSVLATALKMCGDNIEKMSSKVHKMGSDGLARVWGDLKWPFSEKEMQKILDTLRRCAATFQFSLTIEGCALLSRSSENATQSLEIQLQTARKVLELTQNVGTMAESAKEALKVSNQVSEILTLVSDYNTTAQTVQSISYGVTALVTRSQESRETKVLSWLSPHRHSHIHHDIRAKRMADTGQWFLEHKNFEAWMSQSNSILWCRGGPGVGKSVLTSLVIDHTIEKHLSPNEAIAYFYFDYRDQQVQNPPYVLASLLRQLAARRKPIPQFLLEFYDRFKEQQPQYLMNELFEAFQIACAAYDRCFIVIDALDECKQHAHRKQIVELLKSLPTVKTSVFVTSRPHVHDIKEYFEDALLVDVEASEADIKHYCSRMIEQSPNAVDLISGSLKQQVVNSISEKAHGMFLLPVLQLKSVLEAMTKSEVKASLGGLSADLGQAFENTIRRIENEPRNRRHVATQALMWVSHARRPLKINELCHALATKVGDTALDQDSLLPPRSIIESCSGLIVLDDESSTVRLVHYTLKDHLQSRQSQSFLQEETYITQILITYLCLNGTSHGTDSNNTHEHESSEDSQGLLLQSLFLQYAAANWGHHAKLSQRSEINELALEFLNNTTKLTRATQSLTRSFIHGLSYVRHRAPWESRYRYKSTAMHLVAGFGLVELLGLLLGHGFDINIRDSYKNTAVHSAIFYGQLDALEYLLERGAEINVMNIDRNTPLFLAVSFSREELLPTLLNHGANVDDQCKDYWSPLHKAADNGHITIAQKVLHHGASVTKRSARGLIPLHRASGRGHVQMIHLLLHHGSPVNDRTFDGWTPLHGASSSGQDDAVKILLEHGAEINRQSEDLRTALHRACRSGNYNVVSRLLGANADPLVRDCNGNIPLHRAAKGGYGRICSLLLQQKWVSPLTQLSALNVYDRKPEKEAFNWGHPRVAGLLRYEESKHKGVGVERLDDLEIAIEEGDLPRVTELLSNGAEVNKASIDSLTPLHRALFPGNEPIARLLLRHNANVTMITSHGWQPLHCAASKGMSSMVSLCLDRGADINTRTLDGQTALHKACNSGNLETVQVVLDSGSDIEAQDDWGWRALHTASAAGHQNVVEFLIARNANLEARDKELRTVQQCAAMTGKHDLAEYLRQVSDEPIGGESGYEER